MKYGVYFYEYLLSPIERRLHPMVKIVTYLFDRELRPVELLRMMDKTVSFKLTPDEFFYRCHVSNLRAYRRFSRLLPNLYPMRSNGQITCCVCGWPNDYTPTRIKMQEHFKGESSYSIVDRLTI